MNNQQTVIVTGSTGFIGSHLVPFLINKGFKLILPVRESSAVSQTVGITYWEISEDWTDFDRLLQKTHPCGVIHLATKFLQSHSAENIPEVLQANVEIGTRMLESATKANISWFINIGTYWQHFNGEKYNPVNLYAATKQAFETIACYYQQISPMKFVTLCLNDTYGPGDTRKKLFSLWKDLITNPEIPMQMSEGEQLLDILYIDDVINGIHHLMTMLKNNTFQADTNRFYLTSNALLSLRHAAETFAKVSGSPLNIEWGKRPYRPKEVMYPKCYGIPLPEWHPQVSLEEGIKKFINAESDQ